MNSTKTKGIVLRRIKFGEADMIITLLTPDQGKIRVIAKGVRKSISKLAGGIELFSESNVSFLQGKGEVFTLISSRLIIFYKNIVTNLEKTNTGYEIIKIIDKASYDDCEETYYHILSDSLKEINKTNANNLLVSSWVYAQVLNVQGHSPNLNSDSGGDKLAKDKNYSFDVEAMCFRPVNGNINENDIKLLRLLFSKPIEQIAKVENTEQSLKKMSQLLKAMLKNYVNV